MIIIIIIIVCVLLILPVVSSLALLLSVAEGVEDALVPHAALREGPERVGHVLTIIILIIHIIM